MTAAPDVELVTVRRQWNDWRHATVPISELDRLHLSDVSGGVAVRAPREFLHAYILCSAIVDGEIAHSCRHGRGPHYIKVCIVQRDNPKELYKRLKDQALGPKDPSPAR
jgi:hypothetical protein